ncbi:MAG: DUF5518 domain-containing protein [Methanobacterium sp.]|nr:DUF5518 domain-containing protein [Methanobacterium sp.]
MVDWNAVGVGSLVNAVLTIVLTISVFPLFFLGPIVGGLVATYIGRGKKKDAPVEGALTGIIGGLIIGILFIAGFGALSAIIGLIFAKVGLVAGAMTLIAGLFITVISIFLGGVLGAVGGLIGAEIRENGSKKVKVEN